ncbi:hypothetical protein BDFB_006815, partial [Asbolus verrucosus]
MMKYEEKEVRQVIQNDVLDIYRKISIVAFQNNILKIMLYCIFSALTALEIMQTYMFLNKFEGVYFIRYAPLYVGMSYILLCTATTPYSTNVVDNIFKKIPVWKVDCADDETKEKIKKEAKFLNGFIIFFVILASIIAILHMIPDPDDKNILYPFALFAEIPEWENTLGWCFRSTFPFLGLLMLTPYCQVIYCCSHIKFQMYLFIYYVKNIDKCFEEIDGDKLFYTEDYQKEIEKRLLFCIKHHIECY